MKRIIFYSWIVSLSVIIYALLPATFSYSWNPNEKNQVYGNYLQSTGGDFKIIKETIDSEIVGNNEKIFEINLQGKDPATEYDFSNNYEFLISKFILKGNVIGKEKIDGLGTYYIFEVTDYKLGEYLPKLWKSNGILFDSFPIVLIIFIISSLGLIYIRIRKHRLYPEMNHN